MEKQNVAITERRTTGIRVTLCAANTSTLICTSYPVFSEGTNDGTTTYAINSPLKQLSPAGSFASLNAPTFTYSAATRTGLLTFNYGLTFDPTIPEYQAASTPRRYKYILAVSGYSPSSSRWDPGHTASSMVVLHGQVDVFAPRTQVSSSITICALQVE